MARKTARPGRTLGVFFLGLAIAFGLVALAGTWKPELGLDLQGGTSIRLTPKGNPTSESLNEARKIIDQRVNGSGVAEAEVTVQGNKYIVVEIPGDSRRDLVDTVKRQAQLRFRAGGLLRLRPQPLRGRRHDPHDPAGPDRARHGPAPAPASRLRPRRPPATPPRHPTPRRPPTAAPRATRPRRPAAPTARRSTTPTAPTSPSPTEAPSDARVRCRADSTEPSEGADGAERCRHADRRTRHPEPRGRRRRRRPAQVDRGPQPGGDRRLQRVHLSAGRHAGQRRRRPEEAAGQLRVGRGDRGRPEVPALRLDDRGQPARLGQRRRSRRTASATSSPSTSTVAAPTRSARSPRRWSARAARSRRASSSPSSSTARCCPHRP